MYIYPSPPAEPEDLLELLHYHRYKGKFYNLIDARFSGSPADRKLIKGGYEFYAPFFAGINRDSGGSYMNGHLVPVSTLIIEYWEIPDAVLANAALGHDIYEDIGTNVVPRSRIVKEFCHRVDKLIWGVTKPDPNGRKKRSLDFCQHTIAKVEKYGSECIFLKGNADRLHNMLTLWGDPDKKRFKIWETERFILPLLKKHRFPIEELQKAIAHQRKYLHIDDRDLDMDFAR